MDHSTCFGPSLDPRFDGQLLPLMSDNFPIAVCWSPKAGCTTVLKWFLSHQGLLEEAVAYAGWVHDYREQRLCAGHDYRRSCERLFSQTRDDKYVVKVIRDPARRAVSGYIHLLRCAHQQHWPAGAAVHGWNQEAGLGRQNGLSFRQFLQFLADSHRHGRAIDPHFRAQYDPLQDPHVHAHVPLEHLSTGLADLERRFRLPHVDVRRLSESGHHNPPTRHCHWLDIPAAFPADRETLETLGTPSPEAFLDTETVDLVREVYRADYEAYGTVYSATKTTLSIHPANSVRTAENAPGDDGSSLRRAA